MSDEKVLQFGRDAKYDVFTIGKIYVDGKFFGNTPSDISLPLGEHVVKVTFGRKDWTRTVQITGGEIQLRAELP